MDFLDHLKEEKEALRKAPLAFGLLLVTAFIASVIFMDFLHADRFASLGQQVQTAQQATDLERSRNQFLTERIQGKDDQLNDYRSRLALTEQSKSPEHSAKVAAKREQFTRSTTRFSNASNIELAKFGGKLSSEIRDLAKKAEESLDLNPPNGNAVRDAMSNADFEYATKYQADAIVLRDEMLSRLPLVKRPVWSDVTYEHPTNTLGLKDVAADLDRLAKMLPLR